MYADNEQISERQLFRQIVTALLGIYLLSIPVIKEIQGLQGILSLFAGTVIYLFLGIYFVRIKTVFMRLEKYMGRVWEKIFTFLYLTWLWLAGVYLLIIIARMTGRFFIEDSRAWLLILTAAFCAYLGSHQGLERRARVAEVSFPLFLLILAGMLCFAAARIKPEYFMELGEMSLSGTARGTYRICSRFLPFALLPFTLGHVEKAGKAGKTISGALLLISGILAAALLLLWGTFGVNGFAHKNYPMIDLLSGVRFPGGFVERADVFWTSALLFGLLFSLGSVFFYHHELLRKIRMEKTVPFLAVLIPLGAVFCEWQNVSSELFWQLTEKFYTPAFFALLLYAGFCGKKKRTAAKAAALLVGVLCLSGCGIALEKRVFPLSVSADYRGGQYEIIYGIPKLGEVTGQNKEETQGSEEQAVRYTGKTVEEAEENFNRNQEKYLDRGHIKALLLGDGILKNREKLEEFLDYMEEQPSVGANMYVFACAAPQEVMSLELTQTGTVGEYLSQMLENQENGKKKEETVLQDLYNARHRNEEIPRLRRVTVVNKKPRFGSYF